MKKLFALYYCLLTIYFLNAQVDTIDIVEQYELAKSELVLLKNGSQLIPIKKLNDGPIALIGVGLTAGCNLRGTLQRYTQVDAMMAPKVYSLSEAHNWIKENLSNYQAIVLGINDYDFAGVAPYTTHNIFIRALLDSPNLITVVFGGQEVFSAVPNLADGSNTLLVSPYNNFSHGLAAQAIMGGIGMSSQLIADLPGTNFKVGDGQSTQEMKRLRFSPPELVGMNSQYLRDSIQKVVQEGLDSMAYPGAQVIVVKDGHVVYHETFGHHTYDTIRTIKKDDLFDYASLTKVTSSLPALMQLHGEGKFNLDATLADYLPYFKNSNIGKSTFRSMLAHNARLRPWIPYWRSTIKGNKKYPWQKNWATNNRDGYNFKGRTFSQDSTKNFPIRITEKLWLHRNYKKQMYKAIKKSPLNEKPGYVYSGLLFYLLPEIVAQITGEDFETYLKENIYRPIGAHTITYNPYLHFPLERIVPTENDDFFRFKQLHGTVHDEGAAMMGGVSSNAGLFSTAIDLAKLMQTYLDEGKYGGLQVLPEASVLEFSKCQYCNQDNRRGLGFDKPLIKYNENASSVAKDASPSSFGHSGYTGTFAWADPEHRLVYIFFSNRVYPTRENPKLYRLSIRPRIHQIIYDSMK